MTDDTIEITNVSPIKPVEPQPEPEPVKAADPEPMHEIEPEPTAKEKLRAFEDKNFGADAVRVNDQIERGHGSPFAEMDDDKRRQYAAIEQLVLAEQKLADSTAALASAEADHEAALAALAASEANASG